MTLSKRTGWSERTLFINVAFQADGLKYLWLDLINTFQIEGDFYKHLGKARHWTYWELFPLAIYFKLCSIIIHSFRKKSINEPSREKTNIVDSFYSIPLSPWDEICRSGSVCVDCAGWSGSINYAEAMMFVFLRDGSKRCCILKQFFIVFIVFTKLVWWFTTLRWSLLYSCTIASQCL